MNKVVNKNKIKEFWIIFLIFIVLLNALSIVLYKHTLFYYLVGSIPVYESWTQDKFSPEYINIIKFSNISRTLIPIILVCFSLFIYFIRKKVKNNRRIIYPVMFLLLLFVIEYIVLSFFNYRFSFLKFGCSGWNVPEYICVGTYIKFFNPFSLVCIIIFTSLFIVGNMLDNKNEKNMQVKKIENDDMKKFWIIFSVFILGWLGLSIFLFGKSSVIVDTIVLNTRDYYRILKYSTFSKFLIPVVLLFFLLFIIFIKKKIINHKRIVYPILFLLFLLVIEFIYLSCFSSSLSFLHNYFPGMWSAMEVDSYIFYPLYPYCTYIFTSLYIIGYLLDNKEKNIKISKIIFRLICSFFIINLIQNLVGLIFFIFKV